MIAVGRSQASALAALFEHRSTLRAVVDAVLEGRVGRAHADGLDAPQAGRLSLGCYAIFGGDASAGVAERLVRDVGSPRELLIPDRDDWRALLDRMHGPRLSDRPMRAFDPSGIDPDRLDRLAAAPPDYELRALDVGLVRQVDDALAPHALQAFDDADHFCGTGLGFAAVRDGKPASVASSYAVCRERIELAIATHPAHRGRGLARATAARLMAYCLRRGIAPEWSAANPISQHLAVTLGYRPAQVIEIRYLAADDAES